MNALVSMLCLIASAASTPAVASDETLDEALLAGEILGRESQSDAAGGSAHMEMLVLAPARAVWDVIVSCELAFAFVEGLRSCAVLEESDSRAVVRQVVDQGWLSPTYDFVFESLRTPYERIEVRLVEGNLRALEAMWVFRETGQGTRVDYQVRVEPSMPAPGFLVRRNLRRGVPDMLACIRGLAEGSGSPDRRRDDLRRCPGAVPESRGGQ
jgi:ribosome-associated toxin RatA of RatAB toxin-antitoxin module